MNYTLFGNELEFKKLIWHAFQLKLDTEIEVKYVTERSFGLRRLFVVAYWLAGRKTFSYLWQWLVHSIIWNKHTAISTFILVF